MVANPRTVVCAILGTRPIRLYRSAVMLINILRRLISIQYNDTHHRNNYNIGVNIVQLRNERDIVLFIGERNQPHENRGDNKPRNKQYIIVSIASYKHRQSLGINVVICS